MPPYERRARTRLRDKVAAELRLLDLIHEAVKPYPGGSTLGRTILVNRQPGRMIGLSGTITIGGRGARRRLKALVDEMSALTFLVCFRILDMIAEWILGERARIQSVPDAFWKRAAAVLGLDATAYPEPMRSQPFIGLYLFSLYDRLRRYRNEIVHGEGYSVLDGTLTITLTGRRGSGTLVLTPAELGALVKVVVAGLRLITRQLPYDEHVSRSPRHYLDLIQKCHGRPSFGQAEPVFENVVLKVPERCGAFTADLDWMRHQVAGVRPGKDVLIDLTVVGLVDDRPRYAWRFSPDEVREVPELVLRRRSRRARRVTVPDLS